MSMQLDPSEDNLLSQLANRPEFRTVPGLPNSEWFVQIPGQAKHYVKFAFLFKESKRFLEYLRIQSAARKQHIEINDKPGSIAHPIGINQVRLFPLLGTGMAFIPADLWLDLVLEGCVITYSPDLKIEMLHE